MFRSSVSTLFILTACLMASFGQPTDARAEDRGEMPVHEPMTLARLRSVLLGQGLTVEGDWPQVAFYVRSSRIYALVDEPHDRMRFMVPVAQADKLEGDQLRGLLKANFVATGDIRFAINHNVVWLVYVHPFSRLTDAEVVSAVNQLAYHAAHFLDRTPNEE